MYSILHLVITSMSHHNTSAAPKRVHDSLHELLTCILPLPNYTTKPSYPTAFHHHSRPPPYAPPICTTMVTSTTCPPYCHAPPVPSALYQTAMNMIATATTTPLANSSCMVNSKTSSSPPRPKPPSTPMSFNWTPCIFHYSSPPNLRKKPPREYPQYPVPSTSNHHTVMHLQHLPPCVLQATRAHGGVWWGERKRKWIL